MLESFRQNLVSYVEESNRPPIWQQLAIFPFVEHDNPSFLVAPTWQFSSHQQVVDNVASILV